MSGYPGPAIPPSPSRDDHASGATGNFCSEVTPGYRRPGRGR